MGDLGQTRVFGQEGSETVVIGLRRRVLTDLYHRLVTGGWLQLLLVFALVYFSTRALLEVAHWALAGAVPAAPGSLMAAAVALYRGGRSEDAAAALDPRALAAGALGAVDGFVRWTELVIGAGIVMAKFSMQKARVLFSQVAVVAPHDGGGQALLFRVANKRSGHVVDARVSLLLVRNEREPNGELFRRAHDLPLLRGGTALFEHAWTAVHEIDRSSPLFGESAESLSIENAELLVTFSGYDERLLQLIHARHVYPANCLRFGCRFAPIATVLPDGRRALDYRRFHSVVPIEEAGADRSRRQRTA
ncbi:MAG TPA: potassium transporter [Anaeromyxobacter sp.]|nr:potassium transporter [Anaeromyxobacter sp.]